VKLGKAVVAASILAVAGAFGTGAQAAYPEREVRLIVPFPPGGSTDIVGRIAAQGLSARLGQPVVVENRGGAGGTVGTQAASTMPPDGYTLTVATTSTHVVGPLTNTTVTYKPVEGFSHIGMIGETPYVMVISPKVAANTVQDVITLARQKPGSLNFGSAGQGSTTHLAGEMFLAATGVKMEHIPYKGNADATKAVMQDEVQVLFGSMPAVLAQIRAGSIRALAVGTTERSPQLPDVPTMQQAGVKDYRASLWLGLSAPAGVPQPIVERLAKALEETVKDPKVAEQLAKNGAEATVMKPAEFRKLIADELKVYGQILAAMKK
jgi:tripartite-type tricarboxylate transporter receptor subunit TctC